MRHQNNSTDEERLIIDALLDGSGSIDVKKINDFDYLLSWAKMNGVLFLFALYMRKTKAPAQNLLNNIYTEQKMKAEKLAEVTRNLLTLFGKHGIRLLPIKTFLQFPYVDDDLDIVIVDFERLAEYREILVKNGYRYLKSRSSLREPKKRFYFAKGEDDTGLRIHIHFAVSWNGVDYLDIKKVFERRRSIKIGSQDIPIPSVEDEILIMAAHAVHENRYILFGEILQLKELTSSSDIDWDYIVSSAKKYNWLAGLFLFFVLSNKIMQKINQKKPFPDRLLARLARDKKLLGFIESSLASYDIFSQHVHFPVITPFFLTSLTFFNKFIADLKEKKKSARELGREFIAYTLVDWAVFWRFNADLRNLKRLK